MAKPPKWPAERVEMRNVSGLVPYARNARTHSDEQVGQIAASIKEWGWTVPVLVDEAGMIIAGHGRIMAAQRLGLDSVPVMVAAGWSDAKKRAYVLADNKLAMNAGWDNDLLALELGELREEGFDLDLTGFNPDELTEAVGMDSTPLDNMPPLPDGDKPPFQQMTFTLHDDQAEVVRAALDTAKALGAFVESPNENSNGNALNRVCELFLAQHGNR